MIDTRKYKGHTPAPWKPVQLSNRCWTVGNLSVEWQEADKNLIADAPLLLAEVKRLREEVKMLWQCVDTEQMYNDGLLTVEGELIE
tara:strand:- start:139 stop:396 length:258 start_codon:yes stop_codon:yes gene_type:complete